MPPHACLGVQYTTVTTARGGGIAEGASIQNFLVSGVPFHRGIV